MMNKDSIGRGVIYLYIEAITMLFSGYIYWLILSKIIDPSSIGVASTVIAFSTIVFSFASMGITGGIQRYIAKGIAENKYEVVQSLINSALIITSIGVVVSGILILSLNDLIATYFDIDFSFILLSIALFVFLVFSALLRAIIIPSLKVKVITIASVVSTLVKIIFTVALVFLGYGVYGIVFGFMTYPIISTIIFTFAIKNKIYKIVPHIKGVTATKEILAASITFWIPAVISTVGSQLGTITVFLVTGSGNAGIYFISFSIISGILVMTSVLSSVAYPAISTIKDGKKRATWRLIKISLLLTIPISNILIFYPDTILLLFGTSYAIGSPTLQILSLTSLPTCISTGIGVLLYSYSNNRSFLFLGLATSIPRVMSYFILVPIFGGNGAALSYLIGSIIGALIAIWYAKKISIILFYKQIFYLFMIPIVLAIPLKLLEINPVISIVIILISSYLIFLALKMIDPEDIDDILKILPKGIARTMSNILQNIRRGK